MSRRRNPQMALHFDDGRRWVRIVRLKPVEAARRERVRRQIQHVKRRAARRWTP